MKACLDFDDILAVGQPKIDELRRIGDSFASAEAPGAGAAFTRQVRIVEGVVIHTYGVAATLARKADDLSEVAEVWSRMSLFCQSALHGLSSLKHKYPDCGAPALYDLVLDYKLACDKRCKRATEERACQKTPMPKGLLPELR